MLADMVDEDLGLWAAAWLAETVTFTKEYDTAPSIEQMPPVMGPQWTVLANFIAGGGLRNLRLRHGPVAATVMSPTKRSPHGANGGGGGNRGSGNGRCFAQGDPGGCQRRNCIFDHDTKEGQPA